MNTILFQFFCKVRGFSRDLQKNKCAIANAYRPHRKQITGVGLCLCLLFGGASGCQPAVAAPANPTASQELTAPAPQDTVTPKTALLTATSTAAPTRTSPTVTPLMVLPSATPPLLPTNLPGPALLLPDSELVYSPTALNFNTTAYLERSGGFLSAYRQYLMISGWSSTAQIVERVAIENSINPRLILALLEYQSGSVLGQPADSQNFKGAMGASQYYRQDLYGQLIWAVHELSEGYYGWRNGTLTQISLSDGRITRLDPELNAGTVALHYFFAQLYTGQAWDQALDPQFGFSAVYASMFGDPWAQPDITASLDLEQLSQPILGLPFEPGKVWALTGGPHKSFESNGPLSALDFAPRIDESGCYPSNEWVVAMADGLVVRSEEGVVIQDLDLDGHEQTGWNLMYLHIGAEGRVPVGTFLNTGDRIGHPSCEGGRSTGTHVHIARKYNGEWIAADGALPFVLDGWTAHAGSDPYQGSLTRGEQTVTAHVYGSAISHIRKDIP